MNTAIGFNSGLLFTIGSTAVSTLQLDAAPGAGNSFTFEGSVGALALTGSAARGFDDTIVGLNVGSTLAPTNFVDMLGDPTVTVDSGQLGFGDAGTVVLSDGAVLNLTGITNGSGIWHVLTTPDKAGTGTEVFLSTVCYVRGTMIRTADGELPVESLLQGAYRSSTPGQMAREGRKALVNWSRPSPHRSDRASATRRPWRQSASNATPFPDGMPHRDLLVSSDHAYLRGRRADQRPATGERHDHPSEDLATDSGPLLPRGTGRSMPRSCWPRGCRRRVISILATEGSSPIRACL